ncbi:hypothetical protein WN943_003867 [Citrus x changshan-huyou]
MERLLLGRPYSCVVNDTLLKLVGNFDVFDVYLLGTENNNVHMPTVGIDNNMYENIIEDIVRSMRSELENFKNQVKVEMMEEMKLWHMIAIEEISKPRKMEI